MRKQNTILFLVIFFISFLFNSFDSSAQQYWMEQGGGVTIDEAADISIDAAGNTYATGYFTGTATFGTISLSSSGTTDIYLAKLNPAGIYQWVVKAGGLGSDRPYSIKTDAAGNSYITGFFYGTATFGSYSIVAAGLQDVFIAKYDVSGNCTWVKNAGGNLGDIGSGITVDNAGNVIVTGEFAGSASFGSTTLTSMNNSVDVFTTKLDGNGNFLWAKKGSAPQTDRGIDVAADATGNIYVTGQFTDTITFDVTHTNNMYNAIFLIKYNSAGAEQWFRIIGGASQSIANAIAVGSDDNPVIAGDFLGTLTFFAAPTNSTLSGAYSNKIFVAKYDANGNKLWGSGSSSSSPLTAHNLAIDASNNPFVIGNFKCKLNDYADLYGQGTFNSVGYWDIYVSKWNSSGAWQWARQVGGRKDDYGMGITLNINGDVIFTGSFNAEINIPVKTSTFLGYNSSPDDCFSAYCGDNNYGIYETYFTSGNSDIIISKGIDTLRQPYDFYNRFSTGCIRNQLGVCISGSSCTDTVVFCHQGTITADPQTCYSIDPGYSYAWSTGSTSSNISVVSSGLYSVTQSSPDGCFISLDTIRVIIYPNPPPPTISDDVVINTNSTNPQPINLCLPDSAVLTGGNFGNNSYEWFGPGYPNVSVQSITVTQTGIYYFTVTDTNGCSNTTGIQVNFYPPLPPFNPKLICLDDPDMNDTVSICLNHCYQMMVYDSITNPGATYSCLPYLIPYTTLTTWTIVPSSANGAHCNAIQDFCPLVSGLYTINVMLIRQNICDTDTFYLTKPIYVIVNPNPTATLNISGNTFLCPGDSTMLVASGACTNPLWYYPGVSGFTGDSVWASQAGYYSVSCTITNSYGCTATATATVFVQIKPQPQVNAIPSNGLICPPDSVQLICLAAGTYQWQGPSGPVGGNTSSIYVSQPGNYYCIVTDADTCVLVSNTILVYQYSTPYLIPPLATICQGDSLIITVVASPGFTVQWLAPLSGTSLSQTVTSPGIYSCQVVSCGITTIANTTVNLSVPTAQITATGPLIFCQGDSVTLIANAGMSSYIWNPGLVSAQSYTVSQSGVYTLTTSDSYNCTASDVISLYSYPDSTVIPGTSDTLICMGQSITLIAAGTGNINWYSDQTSGNVLSSGNTFTTPVLSSTTTYYIASTDSVCRSEFAPFHVMVYDCADSIPNVFTPNGDGKNDVFYFPSIYSKCFEAKIYNRWGKLIYEWGEPSEGWNGKTKSGTDVSDGVYYYILKYCDGFEKAFSLHGYIELIRGQ